MPNNNTITHSDSDLQSASKYLVYHVRMYVETKLWLDTNHPNSIQPSWETIWNAVLEDHLIHARVLIHFLSRSRNSKTEATDVLALDYFYDNPSVFTCLTTLDNEAKQIGAQMVHLTTKAMPLLKSNQIWPTDKIMMQLVPTLKDFFILVEESRLESGIKAECLLRLAKLAIPNFLYHSHHSHKNQTTHINLKL